MSTSLYPPLFLNQRTRYFLPHLVFCTEDYTVEIFMSIQALKCSNCQSPTLSIQKTNASFTSESLDAQNNFSHFDTLFPSVLLLHLNILMFVWVNMTLHLYVFLFCMHVCVVSLHTVFVYVIVCARKELMQSQLSARIRSFQQVSGGFYV